MTDHQAVLELVFRAANLGASVVGDVVGDLGKVGTAATGAAGKVAGAFAGMGRSLSVGLGSAVDSLVTGGDLGSAAMTMAGFLAGEFTENFGGQIIERLASSGIVAAIAGPLGAIGSAMGSIIAAAVPIGIAALPFILVGALIAAIAILIANEGIRNRVIGFASGIVKTLGDALGGFLGALPGIFGKAFAAAWDFVLKTVLPTVLKIVEIWLSLPLRIAGLGLEIVKTIIGGLVSLPGRLADVIRDAIAGIRIDIGPFHLSAAGFRVDAPSIPDLSGIVPHFATGVTGFRGGFAVVGERGPELVRLPRGADVLPNSRMPSMSGVVLEGVTIDQLVDAVDRGLYFRLRRAAPTSGRV